MYSKESESQLDFNKNPCFVTFLNNKYMTYYIFKFIDTFHLFMAQLYNKNTIHPQEPQKYKHKVPCAHFPQRE